MKGTKELGFRQVAPGWCPRACAQDSPQMHHTLHSRSPGGRRGTRVGGLACCAQGGQTGCTLWGHCPTSTLQKAGAGVQAHSEFQGEFYGLWGFYLEGPVGAQKAEPGLGAEKWKPKLMFTWDSGSVLKEGVSMSPPHLVPSCLGSLGILKLGRSRET